MSEIRAGDRVKITITDYVRGVYNHGSADEWFGLRNCSTFLMGAKNQTIEVIERPALAYQERAVYIDADGQVFQFRPDLVHCEPWFMPGDSESYSPDYPTQPLRRLIPEVTE